jgi:hypothetical protein
MIGGVYVAKNRYIDRLENQGPYDLQNDMDRNNRFCMDHFDRSQQGASPVNAEDSERSEVCRCQGFFH